MYSFKCANASDHTFEKGYNTVLNLNVARIANDFVPLTRLGQFTEETIVSKVCHVANFKGVRESTFEEKFLQDIMLYPVMLLKRSNQKKARINNNEMLLMPTFFVYLFNGKSEVNINKESNTTHKTLTDSDPRSI